MIYSICHPGSGVGNQLHRYVAGRVLALDKGLDFSVIDRQYSKVKSFMNLDFGVNDYIQHHIEEGSGKLIPHTEIPLWEEKTGYFNPEFFFVEDNTIIDGEFQSIQYFGHRLNEINEWLRVEPIETPHGTCVIGFRGGEFAIYPELFLTSLYWDEGISRMKQIDRHMRFEVHTDDVDTAKLFFPNYPIIHDVGINWRSIRSAKYAIIANSSFYILPRLLKHHEARGATTIAPRYWARHNTKEWSRPDNYYKQFIYI